MSLICPLCDAQYNFVYHRDKRREYWCCERCFLVFVPPEFLLDAEAERKQYDLHENFKADEGYKRFLSRVGEPLLRRLSARALGLDFGCGPAPVLADMLRQAGHDISLYDIFYAKNEDVWQQSFQFITATEVVEHLSHPGIELARLWGVLKPNGYFAVMTKLVIDPIAFSRWHYKNDPTHVCFFSQATFKWWADANNARIEFIDQDVIFLQKNK